MNKDTQRMLDLLQKTAQQEYLDLQRRLTSENEIVAMFPLKVKLKENGLIDKISVLSTKKYFAISAELEKDYCSKCGKLVESEVFICDKKGQKYHIECFTCGEEK